MIKVSLPLLNFKRIFSFGVYSDFCIVAPITIIIGRGGGRGDMLKESDSRGVNFFNMYAN